MTETTKKIALLRLIIVSSCLLTQLLSAQPVSLPEPLFSSDFMPINKERVRLGQLLFFDPVLSGNKNISCATCHHPDLSTADGVSLSIGEGGRGLGNKRVHDDENPPEQFIGRHAPALFNLGAKQFTSLFHDGRLELDESFTNGIRTPLGQAMMVGFDSVLSAQSMFPIVSPDEMAGHNNENEISIAIRKGQIAGKGGAWDKVAQRIRNIPEYVRLFIRSSKKIRQADDIKFTHISNAIADFIAAEWQAIDSPFDDFLRGNITALNARMKIGMDLFYGKAACSTCHSGALQTDHQFHAIAMPQFGPGKTARFETNKVDTGRWRVTGLSTDAYKFRTPSLRNIALTAPFGHNGAFTNLTEIIKHHLDPVKSLKSFTTSNLLLATLSLQKPKLVSQDEIKKIEQANELKPINLTAIEIDYLESFLNALTDEKAGEGLLGTPTSVPSGLVFD